MHRFFIEHPLTEGEVTVNDPAFAHQLKRVLRTKEGERIMVLDNSGLECEAAVKRVAGSEVTLAVRVCAQNKNEPENVVTLYQSILKKDKMEWVCEKATEAGVSRIVPVRSAHSVKQGIRLDRARAIVREAAEQSGRGRIPEVAEAVEFEVAVKEAVGGGASNIIAHNIGHQRDVRIALKEIGPYAAVNVFIGPEGGFSEEEVALAAANDFIVVSLGKRTLRAETAAVVAAFLTAR